jgi:hypothetical protein
MYLSRLATVPILISRQRSLRGQLREHDDIFDRNHDYVATDGVIRNSTTGGPLEGLFVSAHGTSPFPPPMTLSDVVSCFIIDDV